MFAKFVNLFQFLVIKIFPEAEMVDLAAGGFYADAVVVCFHPVDMGPDHECMTGDARQGDPGMVKTKDFVLGCQPFTIAKVQVGQTQAKMEYAGKIGPGSHHDDPNTRKKDHFHQTEKQVYPGRACQQSPAGKYQDDDIKGNEHLTP